MVLTVEGSQADVTLVGAHSRVPAHVHGKRVLVGQVQAADGTLKLGLARLVHVQDVASQYVYVVGDKGAVRTLVALVTPPLVFCQGTMHTLHRDNKAKQYAHATLAS